MSSEETPLKDTLKNIDKKLNELVEKKEMEETSFWSKWKFWEKVNKREIKKNWIQIIFIQDNKNLRILKAPIDENVIMIDNIPHTIDAGDIFLHKNKPTIIVPSWSIKPISPSQNIKETKDAGNSTLGWEYIMNYLKKTEIKAVKNMGIAIWVIVGLLAIGGIWYAVKSGMFT